MRSEQETLKQKIAHYEGFLLSADDRSTREVLLRLLADSKKRLAHVEASNLSCGIG
jgi:hypothetical protein